MRRLSLAAVAVALLLSSCGDPERLLAALGVPDAQDELVQACCDCLAGSLPPVRLQCDNGEGKCLCNDDAETCFLRLQRRDDAVELIGACTLPGGPCEEACAGVLTYEPE